MYNLRLEALKIIDTLIENGHEAYFVGNYPFVKYHNMTHPDKKLKIKQIEIITNATIDVISSLFKISRINQNDYCKSAIIEIMIKQNPAYFKIFFATDYTNIISNKTFNVNSVNEILNNFSFLHETVMMDRDSHLINYTNKKFNAFESIKNLSLVSNGNFREKVLDNPLIMLQLCYQYSNVDYLISESNIKIIANNNSYLKYESKKNILKYFNLILMSKNPIKGLQIIKDSLLNFKYNDIEMFKFLENIDNGYIEKMSNFSSSIDVISRWAYLLYNFTEEEYMTILSNFEYDNKNKVIWLLKNFDLINDPNYKMAILNSKETLKDIVEQKCDVFLLQEMFDRLTKIHVELDQSKEQICKKIIDTICSRPLFTYQIKYTDDELISIANIDNGEWLDIAKDQLVTKILMCDKHPNDDQYLELTKEAIEYGLISTL